MNIFIIFFFSELNSKNKKFGFYIWKFDKAKLYF